ADPAALQTALEFLGECLKDDPNHLQALWLLAAGRSVRGDRQELAAQAAAMNHPDAADARFHFLAGACTPAAGDYAGVLEACQRAAADPALVVESAYLAGWASMYRQDPKEAAQAFRQVAKTADSPSAAHARAILGAIRYHEGAYDEAAQWWQVL